MQEPTIMENMQELAEKACEYTKQSAHITLDYSEGSLTQIEKILGQYHNDLPKGIFAKIFKRGPSQELIGHVAVMYGAYIGEVIRRRYGGEWLENHPLQAGVPALEVAGNTLAPTSKAYKRIVDGPGDSITFFYQSLTKIFQDKGITGIE